MILSTKTIGTVSHDSSRDALAGAAGGSRIRNTLLRRLSPIYLSRLRSNLESVSLLAGEELYTAGFHTDFVYFPENAVISHIYSSASGRTLEVAMIGPEGASGVCGIVDSTPSPHSALVCVSGQALRMSTQFLREEAIRGGRLAKILMDFFAMHVYQLGQRALCGSQHLIDARLCSWLLMLDDRARAERLALTHEQMSLHLGVSRSTISVVAKELRTAGLITYSRGKFSILDRSAIEESACECYTSAKAQLLN
jgi:CRP-like cAMP-binding protein